MDDKMLVCESCQKQFPFSAAKQQQFAERGQPDPKTCYDCYMKTRGDRPARAPMGDRKFYPAKCDGCGKDTEVPFQPTPGKQVFCRECFQQRQGDRPRRF